VYKLTPAKPRRLDISTANLEVIRRGLRLAASAPIGTSAPVFAGYPVAVAGKTGTAQVAGKSDYSWYVSYAPADHPQYVVAVMIEQGGHGGTAAAPAARRIYDALFHVRGDKTVQTGHAD
jgi:penicillin-binding protein 2